MFKLVTVTRSGEEIPALDRSGLHILSRNVYEPTSQIALQLLSQHAKEGETAIWKEIDKVAIAA